MDVPPPSEQDHVRQRFDVEIVKQYALVGPAGVVSRKFYEDTEQALDNAIASQMLWFAIMPVWVQQAKD